MGNFLDQAGGAVVGGALGLILGAENDRRQIKQQQALTDMQLKANKDMALFNNQQQYEMWQKTNYSAQKEQLQKAGLNAGLLYGGGGGTGGASASSGSGVGGGSAPQGGGEAMGLMMAGLQANLIKAQTSNLEADAALKETQANKTAGVDTQEAETRIKSLTQGITNQKTANELMKVEQTLKEMDVVFQGATIEDRVDQVNYTLRRSIAELQKVQNEVFIARETREAQIKIVEQTAIGSVLRNALTAAQTDSTRQGIVESKAKIEQMAAQIAQGWEGLSQGDSKIAIEKFKAEFDANYPGLWDSIGKGFDDGIESIFETLTGSGRPKKRTVEMPKK